MELAKLQEFRKKMEPYSPILAVLSGIMFDLTYRSYSPQTSLYYKTIIFANVAIILSIQGDRPTSSSYKSMNTGLLILIFGLSGLLTKRLVR